MIDSCSSAETKLFSTEEALAIIRNRIQRVESSEQIPLPQAQGRILADTPKAPLALPPYRNSAMDGYALASADLIGERTFALPLAGTAWAGRPFTGTVPSGHCLRIFTGAPMPDTLDTVVVQEQAKDENGTVLFPPGIRARQNVRNPGEDIRQGQVLIEAPKKLTAADIGLLASAGIDQISVKRRIRIACFSTGDELCPIGTPLAPGKIYDSNRYLLRNLLADAAFAVDDLGIIPDDKAAMRAALTTAAERYDAIVTTGGASVGEADFIQAILAECGQIAFWKLAIKPGKPFAFGTLGRAYFFALPGNPVAVIVTYRQLLKPALEQLAGAPAVKTLSIRAICRDDLKKSPGRREFLRGILSQDDNGEFQVESAGRQGSHILTTMSRANCFIVLPEANAGVKRGDRVTVEPFGVELRI